MSLPSVSIHYRRLPDRREIFNQLVLEETPECTVTFLRSAELPRPVRAGSRIILEPGAPVIWFTFPGRWYDVGRFHLLDGTFTGFYANILTPVQMEPGRWETTDLCLDVWVGADGSIELLDEADFDVAVRSGWLDPETAAKARDAADHILTSARAGAWPPDPVEDWTLGRARSVAEEQADGRRRG